MLTQDNQSKNQPQALSNNSDNTNDNAEVISQPEEISLENLLEEVPANPQDQKPKKMGMAIAIFAI